MMVRLAFVAVYSLPIASSLLSRNSTGDSLDQPYVDKYQDLKGIVLSIGHSRSGHSLVGAMLDAHPRIAMSTELKLLDQINKNWLLYGMKKSMLYDSLFKSAVGFGRKKQTWNDEYPHAVMRSWQGNIFQRPFYVGDKSGWSDEDKGLEYVETQLSRLLTITEQPVKLVHVYRHPLDNIASMVVNENLAEQAEYEEYFAELGKGAIPADFGAATMKSHTERYFNHLETMQSLKQTLETDRRHYGGPVEVHAVSQEALIRDPTKELKLICRFLSVTCADEFLKSCANHVWQESRLSRNYIKWTDQYKQDIMQRAHAFPLLNEYTYDDDTKPVRRELYKDEKAGR